MTALREIKLLREIDNPYIVRLLDVFPHKRNLSLVLHVPNLLYATVACRIGTLAIEMISQADECHEPARYDNKAGSILGGAQRDIA